MRKFILIVILLIVAMPFLLMIYNNLTMITVYLEDGEMIGHLKVTPYETMVIDLGGMEVEYDVSNIKFYTNSAEVLDVYDLTCNYFSIYDYDDVFLGNIDGIKQFSPEAGYVYTWTKVRTNKGVLVDPNYAVLGTVRKLPQNATPEEIRAFKKKESQKKGNKSPFLKLFSGE